MTNILMLKAKPTRWKPNRYKYFSITQRRNPGKIFNKKTSPYNQLKQTNMVHSPSILVEKTVPLREQQQAHKN